MKEIKKIDLMSLAKILALIYAIIGFLAAILAVVAMYLDPLIATSIMPISTFGPIIIVLVPIIYAIVGFIIGAIIAILYNIIASKIGGIKIELK